MNQTIVYHGLKFAAAVCPHCGGKVWPADALKAHVERHEARDAYVETKWLRPLQHDMRRSRL